MQSFLSFIPFRMLKALLGPSIRAREEGPPPCLRLSVCSGGKSIFEKGVDLSGFGTILPKPVLITCVARGESVMPGPDAGPGRFSGSSLS